MNQKTIILVLCLVIFPFSAFSGSKTPEDAIQARQQIMEYIGAQMRTLGAIQKGRAEFDPAVTKNTGQAIYSMSLALPFLFYEGTFDVDVHTNAKPEILNSESFDKHLESLQNASLLLSQATSEGEFKEAFSQLGQTCSACHREFRN